MSFSITVAVKNGDTTVQTTGEVPDGEYTVNGHDDDNSRVLGVYQRGTDGKYVSSATHTHYKGNT